MTWRTFDFNNRPTREEAPLGYYVQFPDGSIETVRHDARFAVYPKLWMPIPAPEPAPKPELVERWVVSSAGLLVRDGKVQRSLQLDDQRHLARIANALDRDGVAWGEMRPPETLPETRRVLVAWDDHSIGVWSSDLLSLRRRVAGWWDLPEEYR